MSMPQDQLFETALSLPESQRADLAFLLLQSLDPPGEAISSDEFGLELQGRITSFRSGRVKSFSLDDTRAIVRQRLLESADQ